MRGIMNNRIDRPEIIGALKDKYMGIWENTPDTFPIWQETFQSSQQAEKDTRMGAFSDKMMLLIKEFPGNNTEEATYWGSAIKKLVYDCGTGIIGLDSRSMMLLLDKGFCDTTSDFIEKAKEFDAALKLDDICQALRNVWIMNCIQELMGCKVELTPSVLAYSLLYPYTDNYLDANSISAGKKQLVNQRFERRLAGERLTAETPYENRLFRLVEMIEGQFPRSEFPMVYTSLLGIQAAQGRSLLQHGRSGVENSVDIMDISIEKGGSSVLADACLVKGSLTQEESFFIFGFGILLQLLDDLQDAGVDRNCGHMTIFSRKGKECFSESHTNRLINFTMRLLDEDTCFVSPGAITIKNMINKSIMFLLLGAVACNSKMYGKNYLKMLETHSPLSFSYLKSFYKKIGREYGKLKIKFALNPLEAPMAKAFAAGQM